MLYNSSHETETNKIGLFGGTFDPPHMGHLEVAKCVLRSKQIDAVWLLPCWKHAFGKDPTSFYHRASMCYLLIRNEPNIYVCTDEAKIQSTYSIDILKIIQDTNPNKSFRLILGIDNYCRMNEWKLKDKILELAPPIWVERPGIKNIPESTIKCFSNTSSTEIKQKIELEGHLCNIPLSIEVKKYIAKNSLYKVISTKII